MIIKYAIALAVVAHPGRVRHVGVPARPPPARQPRPAPAAPPAPAAAPRQGLRPRSSPCGCGGAGWPRSAAPAGSAPPCPLRYRLLDPREHSVFLGRAHYRHGLRVPLEEHVLVMAPPRTFKTAFLADVILRYPGPVIATTTKPDVLRAHQRGPRLPRPGARVQPAAHRRRPVHVLLVPGRRLRGPGHRDPPRRRVRVRRVPEGRRRRHLLVRQGQRLPARLLPRRRPGRLRPARRGRLGLRRRPATPRADPDRRRRPPVGAAPWPSCAPRPTRPPPRSGWSCHGRWRSWPTPPWPPASCPPPAPGSTSPRSCADAGTVYMIAESVSEEAPVAPLFAAMASEIHYDRGADRPGVAVGPAGPAAADGPGRGHPDLPGPAAVLAVGLRRQGHPGHRRRPRRGPARRPVGRPRPPGRPRHLLGEGVPARHHRHHARCRRPARCAGRRRGRSAARTTPPATTSPPRT